MGSYRIVSHHTKFPGLQLTQHSTENVFPKKQFRFYNAKKKFE